MKNLDINHCYFHGIRSNLTKNAIEVFENILESKYILTHNSLRKKGMPCDRETSSWQGSNAISICFHPTNDKLYDYFFNKGNTITTEDKAFTQFVDCEKPSIVLNPKIIKELSIRETSGYKRLSDEIQVIGDIPLSYMVAIGYGNDMEKYISALNNFINYSRWDKTSYEYLRIFYELYCQNNLEKVLYSKHQNIILIKELLKKYGYNIPIINPLTGNSYPSFEEEYDILKKEITLIKNVK